MTCIVGFVDKKSNKVYVGADSGSFSGWLRHKECTDKVFVRSSNGDKMIFGICGNVRYSQLLQYQFKIPDRSTKTKDDREYLVTVFAEALRKCLEDNHDSLLKDNRVIHNGRFLLGYRQNLYKVGIDLSVLKSTWGYEADGAGEEFAYGALHILSKDKKLLPKSIVVEALESAGEFSAVVSPPFKVLSI